MPFVDGGFELRAGKYPKLPKHLHVTVDLPILRNVSNICLLYTSDAADE